MEIVTKPKADFRMKKFEVQGKRAIDSIIITYDDKTLWSYGVDGGKTDSKIIIFTEHEYLVRVTHETLENRRWAGAALELETNKGRIFTFEPACAKLPKHNRTTIRAGEGMEIISLKIKFGKLVGFEQQPCDEGEWVNVKDWTQVLCYGEKEDDPVDVKEFLDGKTAANTWWKEVSQKIKKKQGRGALFLDTKHNKIIKQIGSSDSIKMLIKKAEELGLYLNMDKSKASLNSMLIVLKRALLMKEDMIRIIITTLLLIPTEILRLESYKMTGEMISTVAHNDTVLYQNTYANFLCRNIMTCSPAVKYDYCLAMLVSFVVLVLLERITDLTLYYIRETALIRLEETLTGMVVEKTFSFKQSYHDTHTAGDIATSGDIHPLVSMMTWSSSWLISSFLNICLTAFYLMRMDLKLGGAVVIATLLYAVCCALPLERRVKSLYKRAGKLWCLAGDLKGEVFHMISTIKNFSKETTHIVEQKTSRETCKKVDKSILLLNLQRQFTEHTTKSLILTGILYSIIFTEGSNFRPGEIMTFYLLIDMYLNEFSSFNYVFNMVQRDIPKIETFFEFLDTPIEVYTGDTPVDGKLDGDIKFEAVSFWYDSRPGEMVFTDLNMTIQQNKMTALVGDSGSGKSTIAKLIMRLYDPKEGMISLGGLDIRDYKLQDLHSKIAIVSQNPDLISTTLSENISYGAASPDKITTSRIEAAAKLANCDFIDKFRSGLDTFAGSQGLQLSGGQTQRVAIARAAMRDPDILILDEATSALDAQNEAIVQEALEKLMKNRTTIVIAHRLSTIRNADEILCLKDGKVIERGTHAELMKLGLCYANLVSKQVVEESYEKLKENIPKVEEDMAKVLRDMSIQSIRRQLSKESDGMLENTDQLINGDEIQIN